jgi:hypothetical protein
MEGYAATIVRVCEFICSNLVIVAAGSSETSVELLPEYMTSHPKKQ